MRAPTFPSKQAILLALAAMTIASALGEEREPLPGAWRKQPATDSSTPPVESAWGAKFAADTHSAWYEQTIAPPDAWTAGRVFLKCERIEGDAIVFLDGVRIGELLRPGGEVEITGRLQPGRDATLRVFVTRNYTNISRNYEQDRLRYVSRELGWKKIPIGTWKFGVTGPVDLVLRPDPVAVSDVFVKTSWRNKAVTFEVETDSARPAEGVSVVADIFDAEGKPALSVASQPFHVTAGRTVHEVSAPWPAPIPWELDAGCLYTAKLRLAVDGKTTDTFPDVRFGFREIWTEGRELMLNGHPIRLRLTMVNLFPTVNALSYCRLLGYNAGYIQNNGSMWWQDWAETPLLDEKLLDAMDGAGFALYAPAPSITFLRDEILTDKRVQADYDREMKWFLRKYRNHPSIFTWTVGTIAYCPKENIDPRQMGRREIDPPSQGRGVLAGCATAKRHDATRLAFSHADGSLGDISSANMYLNFAPLQEREEWPSLWAESGDMPYCAIEFGQPYTANFWKEGRCLMTEYIAMYFGDRAYEDEPESTLRQTLALHGGRHGATIDWNLYPMYWTFQRLFVRNTNRAFRNWGVNGGWGEWYLNVQFGNPPGRISPTGHSTVQSLGKYGILRAPLTGKPSWANANFDIHRQANQPLLAYIAGTPRHTDKTHAYFAGERVTKHIAVVWDGPGETRLDLRWSLVNADGREALSGAVATNVAAGANVLIPLAFDAPEGRERTTYSLNLETRQDGIPSEGDRFQIEVFPPVKPLRIGGRIALMDPAGKTAPWLETLGVKATPLDAGASLGNYDVLIVGREALKPGPAPYRAADIARGLRVLVLEQQPEAWRGLGFRTIATMPRYVFATDSSDPLTQGLAPEDLINWRGSPDLLPEGKNQPSETQHAPKWVNTHAVASVALQIPRCVGFTPLLATEFDLDYSPLLEWRHGRGGVWFCTLDLTGRVGTDPDATRVASRLLERLGAPLPDDRRAIHYVGGDRGRALLARLGPEVLDGLPTAEQTPRSLLVVGENGLQEASPEKIDEFVKAGGRAFFFPQTPDELTRLGLRSEPRSVARASRPAGSPLFRSIGPSLLRWRDALEVNALAADPAAKDMEVLADGMFAVKKGSGQGLALFSSVEPEILASRYQAETELAKRKGVELSVIRLEQLTARLLGNLGASAAPRVAERLAFLDLGPAFETLGHWNVLGPFYFDRDDGKAMLDKAFPGEETAIVGDDNPNNIFETDDGRKLDWRGTVRADDTGLIDLGAALHRDALAVAYVTRTVESDTDREAELRVGCDWRMRAWVNGKEVFRTEAGMDRPAAYKVKIRLKQGKNAISLKIGAGSRGFSFYADISKPTPEAAGAAAMREELRGVSFYAGGAASDAFDPFEFVYW